MFWCLISLGRRGQLTLLTCMYSLKIKMLLFSKFLLGFSNFQVSDKSVLLSMTYVLKASVAECSAFDSLQKKCTHMFVASKFSILSCYCFF
ncbi:hypothetical protein JHK87_022195 [Glycine soja]|nr:hypothetical protein JHK87_022195 [Glycine soja]